MSRHYKSKPVERKKNPDEFFVIICLLFYPESNYPDVVEAACDALSQYLLTDYSLKEVPEVYTRHVKLPSSYCKTPADVARKPEEVLDYIPCEWGDLYTTCFILSAWKWNKDSP